jgi:hypothetical protein
MSERMKYNSYEKREVNTYFWRTYDQQEIDLIEEEGEQLYAFQFKWSKKKAKIPGGWKKNYPDSLFEFILPENYLSFVY